jgi:hypothetical protein
VYWQWQDPFSPVSDVMNASSTLDCWSLDSWFSGFNQPDYAVFKEDLIKDVTALLTRVPAARNNADALAGILPE